MSVTVETRAWFLVDVADDESTATVLTKLRFECGEETEVETTHETFPLSCGACEQVTHHVLVVDAEKKIGACVRCQTERWL